MGKVVGGFEKKRCVSTGVRKPGNTCVTDRHDMTLAVKVALNPNTTNQPKANIIEVTFDTLPNCIDSFWSFRHPPLLCCSWSSSLKPENSTLKQDEKKNVAMNSLHRLHPLRTQASLTNPLWLNYSMCKLKLDYIEGAI